MVEVNVFYLGESFMNPKLLVDCIAHLKKDVRGTVCENCIAYG